MKLSARIRGDWLALPCSGNEKVRWLADECLRRYYRAKNIQTQTETIVEVRKTKGGAILDADDIISDILDDNDFINIVLESDMSNPTSNVADIVYFEEKVPQGIQRHKEYITVDGDSMSTHELVALGKAEYFIALSAEAEQKVRKSRDFINQIVSENKAAYGITTGFGKFSNVTISNDNLVKLQENLIPSHAAGVGRPLSPTKARMLLALRINVLAKGYSGISLQTLQQYIDAFNANCIPWIPEKGSVGASGDLAPLAHLALGLMGEGKMWSPKSGWTEAKYVLETNNLQPLKLGPKEGIALINGTQLITSMGAEAVERAAAIARQADIVAAMTVEVLKGTTTAFDEDIHKTRPHAGQMKVAGRMRSLLHSDVYRSKIAESHRFCGRIQDAYTLRCIPQVHGVANDTVDFVRSILSTEINSATDNPMIFCDRQVVLSGGNFHGEYPGKALDYLAIGIHELASISERRIERLVNPALSELPAFLTADGGLNSGFMMAHCTAASLVSENKVLCHPSTVDSIPTSAGTEDHVSMGAFAARKALTVVKHVEHVLAIELVASCQAMEFLRPLRTTEPLEAVYNLVRTVVKSWDKDRYMSPDIQAATDLLRQEKVWLAARPFMDKYNASQCVDICVPSPTKTSLVSPSPPNKRRKTSKSAPETSLKK